MITNEYQLTVGYGYVSDWGFLSAVREIIQNAIDSDSPFTWDYIKEEQKLRIKSEHSSLTKDSLVLGNTSKAENADKIGSFGEGYKLALLVLTRLEHEVTIYNNGFIWTPCFSFSKKFNSELLTIKEQVDMLHRSGLTFEIGSVDEESLKEVRKICLQMRNVIGEIKETPYGDVLLDEAGKLYVGGLFVCNLQGFKYSYNIKPNLIKLERDRQTVSDWDVKLATKDIWFYTGDVDRIVQDIEAAIPDMYHADINTPEIVKEKCYEIFKKKNPNGLIASSTEELNKMIADGLVETRYYGSLFGRLVQNSNSYEKYTAGIQAVPKSCHSILSGWKERHKDGIPQEALEEFNSIIEMSSDWTR